MKRSGSSAREENYEHVLMCLICRSLFDDHDHQPKFLPCHHTFCKDCLREYIRQLGDEIECPSCRKITTIPAAGVAALQTNFYVKYIQALVSGSSGASDSAMQCSSHQQQTLSAYCAQCQAAVCTTCVKTPDPSLECSHTSTKPLTTITEESHQLLDSTFSKANATIDSKKVKLETLLKGLSDEKDDALKKIDSCFEQHVHVLNRRSTLLKNKVIDIFSESVEKIENDLMEISTALTCVVSLKDYHENKISHGDFKDFNSGIAEISEVNGNIEERIRPSEIHIHFEGNHGTDKFKMGVKDLGRVRCVRTIAPRAEPDGNDGGATEPVSMPTAAKAATCDSVSSSAGPEDGDAGYTSSDVIVPSPSSVVKSTPPQDKPKSPQPSSTDSNNVKSKPAPQDGLEAKVPSAGKTSIPVSKKKPNTVGTDLQDGATKKDSNSGASASSTSNQQPKQKPVVSPNSQKKEVKKPAKNVAKAPQENSSQTRKSNLIGAVDKNANAKPIAAEVNRTYTHIPEVVARRKVDKDYYHTVYTSYDEEELMKELRAVPRSDPLPEVDDDSDTLCERQTSRSANMEDSDGWMTLSSGDENGDVLDDIVPEDELTTL